MAAATGGAIECAAGQNLVVDSVFKGSRAEAGGVPRLAGVTSVDNWSFVESVSDDGEGAAASNIGSTCRMTHIRLFRGNAFNCQEYMWLDSHVSIMNRTDDAAAKPS